jgi:hypothetical protein
MMPVQAAIAEDSARRKLTTWAGKADTAAAWKFDYPDAADVETCPSYNHWQWGLDNDADGGLPCPYKDRALNTTNGSAEDIARRYARRNVVYLSGSEDVQDLQDHCETMQFQGKNRHERAYRYWGALQEYVRELDDADSVLRHEIHTVEGSPHDHTLMFQSHVALNAIFGSNQTSEDIHISSTK